MRSRGPTSSSSAVHALHGNAAAAAASALRSASALVAGPRGTLRPPVLPARAARVAMQVAEPPVKVPDKVPDLAPASPDRATSPGKAKKYKLLLFNDNVNQREYVAKVLCGSVPDLKQADAYVIMQKAHKSGLAVVGVWVYEVCEVRQSDITPLRQRPASGERARAVVRVLRRR